MAARSIVVAGEALFDLVAGDGDTLGAHPGGGPFNTARTLGRLGRPVTYLGRVSTDRFGEQLAGKLKDDKVGLAAVVRTEAPTTLALAELDESGSARYRFYTQGTSAPGLTEDDAFTALPAEVGIIHVGTLGLVLEPMASTLEAVVRRFSEHALVMVDPNCRPTIIADEAGYRARLRRVLAATHVVKVSDEDLAWLSPGLPPEDAAGTLLAQGPAVVLLTRGGEGALALSARETLAVPAPPTNVVDTIGAGDAFSGGFLAWWSERGFGARELADRETVREATAFACLVAARTCERPGASPPWRSEVE
jgi:fructokinase